MSKPARVTTKRRKKEVDHLELVPDVVDAAAVADEVDEVEVVEEAERASSPSKRVGEAGAIGADGKWPVADREAFLIDEDEEPCDVPTLIAFDPGGTTGWSVFQVHPLSLVDATYPVLDNVIHWSQGQISLGEDGEAGMIHEMAWLAASWVGAAVLSEDFILQSSTKDRDLLSPVRLMAGLEYALWLQDRKLLVQGRDIKATVTDERLKKWGYYRREGGEVHARDATRHGLAWFRKCKGPSEDARERRARAWPEIFWDNGDLRE